METISWTDRVRNEEVLCRVKEELNVLNTRRQSKANWTGHSLSRTCLLKLVVESHIEWTGKRGIQIKQLICELQETRKKLQIEVERHGPISGTRLLEEDMDLSLDRLQNE